MNIKESINGKGSLESKEKLIMETISRLDIESLNLFNEILDLSDKSTYKLINLYKRASKLYDIYKDTVDAHEQIVKLEVSDFNYATMRYQFKNLLICMTTFILAIGTFVLLSKRANKEYANELVEIYNVMENYDDDKMRVIQATIENCSRLLEGKKNKILEYYDSNKNDIKTSINVISCNDIIRDYIDGSISYEDVLLKINEEIKDDMIEILKQDLNSESNDLFELLEQTKLKENNSLKLILEYEND